MKLKFRVFLFLKHFHLRVKNTKIEAIFYCTDSSKKNINIKGTNCSEGTVFNNNIYLTKTDSRTSSHGYVYKG